MNEFIIGVIGIFFISAAIGVIILTGLIVKIIVGPEPKDKVD